jgi:hypothetical protein
MLNAPAERAGYARKVKRTPPSPPLLPVNFGQADASGVTHPG